MQRLAVSVRRLCCPIRNGWQKKYVAAYTTHLKPSASHRHTKVLQQLQLFEAQLQWQSKELVLLLEFCKLDSRLYAHGAGFDRQLHRLAMHMHQTGCQEIKSVRSKHCTALAGFATNASSS